MARMVHFELNSPDSGKSVAFFKQVFDWDINAWEGPQEYHIVTTGPSVTPGIDGAIMPSADGQPGTVNTLQVDDIDATLSAIVDAGGEIVVEKHPVPTIGWNAYCKDPAGVLFGVHQFDSEAG
jgi:predicted enzyme related to lactoylglutathione lyase